MKRKRKNHGNAVRDAPKPPYPANARRDNASGAVGILLKDWDSILPEGYIRLSRNPEVRMAVGRIADLVSSMPIHVMENSPDGDHRVEDGLSRKLDIEPNPYMTRKSLVAVLVWTLLLDGNGNAVALVKTSDNRGTQWIDAIHPVAPERVSFTANPGEGYAVSVDGVPRDPDTLLHFVCNPSPSMPWLGTGFRVSLRSVVSSLAQEDRTKNAFLSDKYAPSVIVSVNSDAETLSSKEGREELLRQYIESDSGTPWLIPADMMNVSTVKPLTLNDLAISDSVRLDRQSVAAILGVPPFLVGAGNYNRAEWNQFVSATLMPLVRGIEQELTRKLILSPKRYIRFNPWSLYAYELEDLSDIGADLYSHGLMTGNEVRNWIGLQPREGLDELVILENYIPAGRIGDQKKLKDIQKGLKNGTEADE